MKKKWFLLGCGTVIILCLLISGTSFFAIKNTIASKQPGTIVLDGTTMGQTNRYNVQYLAIFVTKTGDPTTACDPELGEGEYIVSVVFRIENIDKTSNNDYFRGFIDNKLTSPNGAAYEQKINYSFLSCTAGLPNEIFDVGDFIDYRDLLYGAEHRYVIQFAVSEKEFEEINDGNWSFSLRLDKIVTILIPHKDFYSFENGRDFGDHPVLQEIYKDY